jgi:hypothetical protein
LLQKVEYDLWRDNKNSFNLIWKYLRKANIHWSILTSYDFNIHRNSCSCYPSKYFRIWNDNEVTVEISFGIWISFFNRFVQKLFSYILFNWPYWDVLNNQNIFCGGYWHIWGLLCCQWEKNPLRLRSKFWIRRSDNFFRPDP